jgi:CRISPR-associated protein Csx17
MAEIVLPGLRPEPLARYLGGLGLLRLVAEQADRQAHGWWSNEGFVLRSALDGDALLKFLLEEYAPTPVAAPWNGGSGFYPKDNREGLDAILASEHSRFVGYRELIRCIQNLLDALEIHSKPEKHVKSNLIVELRAELPDQSLPWLDAALVLTNEGERYPPLLGTGGNDGRLEFSTNFMKRLAELFLGKHPPDPGLLRGALFDDATPGLAKVPIGQFLPAQAGGPNTTAGFAGDGQTNPWTYVLSVEGAMVPSSAATRRLESNRGATPAFPFTVRAALVGYASAGEEETHDELWMPVWTRPSTYGEIQRLFAEGRAKVPTGRKRRREAVDGLDFARAVATLGVDRGITTFTRFGLHQRNGLSYFAVPLGRWAVRESKAADLTAEIDLWLQRLRARSDKLPGTLASAARRVETKLIEACRRDDRLVVLDLLISLGEIETLGTRGNERKIDPLPPLSPGWLAQSDDESPEFRLAACLAGSGIRRRIIGSADDPHVVWTDSATLVSNLIAILQRRELEIQQDEQSTSHPYADAAACGIRGADSRGTPRRWPSFADLCSFIDGALDDRRLELLTRGLMLIDWPRVEKVPASRDEAAMVPTAFALLLLARELEVVPPMPRTPGLLTNAAAGRMPQASELAIRRLSGVGRRFPRARLHEDSDRTRRMAAALAFPVAKWQIDALENQLFPRFRHDLDMKDTNP